MNMYELLESLIVLYYLIIARIAVLRIGLLDGSILV